MAGFPIYAPPPSGCPPEAAHRSEGRAYLAQQAYRSCFRDVPWQTLTPDQRLYLDDFFVVGPRPHASAISTSPILGMELHYTCRMELDEQSFEEPVNTRWSATIRLIEVAGFKALKAAMPVFPAFASGAVVQLPYRMTRFYRTVVERQQDDSEKRFEDFAVASGIQRWAVGGDRLDDTDAAVLINAWEGNGGPYRTMTFTEPERGLMYNAHFVETELVHEMTEPCSNSVRLTLEELK